MQIVLLIRTRKFSDLLSLFVLTVKFFTFQFLTTGKMANKLLF